MGFFNRLFARTETRAATTTTYLPETFGGGFSGGYNDSGVSVSESTALAASAVYSSCKILAEAVAQLPLHVFQRAEGGKDYQHPVARLLAAEPNEYMTAATFREAMMLNLCLYGNAYAVIERDHAGVPMALYPLRSDCTKPIRENGQQFYQTRVGSTVITLSPDQVLHVLNFSLDGFVGISPIQQARQNIGLSIALERFAAKLFSNGGNVGGILKLPKMNDDAMKAFVASWRNNYVGLENALKVAVLEENMSFTPTTIDPEKAQVKEARTHQVLEVARIFRIPPHMLGVMDKASYASLEISNMEFYQQAIQPIVNRFEQEANRKLLLEREKGLIEVRFNMDAMLRASTKERYDTYATAIINGVMTRAEARAKENLPFIAGSDVLLQPLNLTPVGQQPAPAPPTPATSPSTSPTAARALVEEAARRVLTKESKALTRAAKKYAGKPEELRAWAETFYTQHEPLVARVFAAPLTAAGSTINPADYAREHCAASLRSVTEAAGGGADTNDICDEWIDIRPAIVADHLLTKGTK